MDLLQTFKEVSLFPDISVHGICIAVNAIHTNVASYEVHIMFYG